MDCPLLVCVENTCLSLGILKTGPTSQQPPLPLLSPFLPLLLSKTKKAPKKSLKKRTKKKNLFRTLHSQPHIIYHIPSRHIPNTFSKRHTKPPPSTSTMHKWHCHAKKSKTCSVTYLTTRVKKLHLHLHLQGQWTTLIRNFYL